MARRKRKQGRTRPGKEMGEAQEEKRCGGGGKLS